MNEEKYLELEQSIGILGLRLDKILNLGLQRDKLLEERFKNLKLEIASLDEEFLQRAEEILLKRVSLQAEIKGTEILSKFEKFIKEEISKGSPIVLKEFQIMSSEIKDEQKALYEMKLEFKKTLAQNKNRIEDIIKRLKGRAEIAIDEIEKRISTPTEMSIERRLKILEDEVAKLKNK